MKVLKNKDENVHRYAIRGEKIKKESEIERERERDRARKRER